MLFASRLAPTVEVHVALTMIFAPIGYWDAAILSLHCATFFRLRRFFLLSCAAPARVGLRGRYTLAQQRQAPANYLSSE
ncbi:hypothetical protein CJU77_22575 [Pseudomonas fragi]|nr:hypothetical protein CJU77_22575 [Pseudomonas fragi]